MFRTMMKQSYIVQLVKRGQISHYVGSITIDEDLMDASQYCRKRKKSKLLNNNNGARLETTLLRGTRVVGVVCLNGALRA